MFMFNKMENIFFLFNGTTNSKIVNFTMYVTINRIQSRIISSCKHVLTYNAST